MLEIKPVQGKSEQAEFCRECEVIYKVETMAYSAKEDGELLGVCQFRIRGGYGEIYDLKNKVGVNDLEALIIMGRAALGFVESCGVKNAKIFTEEKNLPELLKFKKDTKGEWLLNLEGYFTSPCQQEQKNIKM